MGDSEEYFPRGGKKPSVTYFKQSGNFLGAAEKGERKKQKPKKKTENDDGYLSDEVVVEDDQSFKNCSICLNYQIVKEGQLLLGRVRQVMETKIHISLPCRLLGTVMACHISEAYNKILEAYVNDQTDKVRELHRMFRPGQYVAVKVLEVNNNNLMLTMMPQHINSGRSHTDLHRGALIQAAVSSVEDHGYVMDIGIAKTRAFLPKAATNPELDLDSGELTWCCIKSIVSEGVGSVVTLGNELEALRHAVQRKPTPTLMPGTALDFTVDKSLDNGIGGRVFGDTTAYVQRQQVDKVKGKRPNLGQRIRARVLYVIPTRNTPFLTMKEIFESTYPDLEAEQKFKEGDIIEEAQVIKIVGRSVMFKLGGGLGALSLRRIQVDEELSDEVVVARSYPVGSMHRVRVLCYNLSDHVYSLSDEPAVLAERYFTLRDLAVGQLVAATVKSVADDRMFLSVGRLSGFVPHTHLSESGVYVDPKKASTSLLPKKKYKVGQEVKARVLSLDPVKHSLILTLKPSLLAPGLEVLQSYEKAEVGKSYTGVIVHIRDYLLVSFFNGVVACIPRILVANPPPPTLNSVFHLGQIVNCTILKVDPENKKMTGSLTTAPFDPSKMEKKSYKRQRGTEDIHVPKKKQKAVPENEHADKNDKKKKKEVSKKDKEIDNAEINVDDSKIKQKAIKKKKEKQPSTEDKKATEESDAIETDIHEDSDHVLTPQDLGLIDLSDCTTAKCYKKRINSLLKSVNARNLRIKRIEGKIAAIEDKGLDAKNKKFHTAMHSEKLVIQERILKLMAALQTAQDRLKEFDIEEVKDYKKKKEKKVDKEKVVKTEDTVKELEKEKPKAKEKRKINKIETIEPVLDFPSVKDFWSAPADSQRNVPDQDSSSSGDEEEEKPKKKRKKLTAAEKVAKAREEEERIRRLEQAAAAAGAAPRSAEQFERALLAEPNCSQLWIAYMAFHLQATEIEKARAVGRKALKTISFREEEEKLNVWLAMLNVEHRFGTKESQQKTLEEALQMNDKFKVHTKLLEIYVDTGKAQELANLVDLMLRKYKRDVSMYVACGSSCFKLGLLDKARHVMQKGIAVLEKKEHVSLLVQFAQLERRLGEPERAEALFEHVLAAYPQRVDVCAHYLHVLRAGGHVQRARQVMERMTSQKLPARKMKVLFKEWIELEEKIGDQEHIDSIRKRAMEYIDKAKF